MAADVSFEDLFTAYVSFLQQGTLDSEQEAILQAKILDVYDSEDCYWCDRDLKRLDQISNWDAVMTFPRMAFFLKINQRSDRILNKIGHIYASGRGVKEFIAVCVPDGTFELANFIPLDAGGTFYGSKIFHTILDHPKVNLADLTCILLGATEKDGSERELAGHQTIRDLIEFKHPRAKMMCEIILYHYHPTSELMIKILDYLPATSEEICVAILRANGGMEDDADMTLYAHYADRLSVADQHYLLNDSLASSKLFLHLLTATAAPLTYGFSHVISWFDGEEFEAVVKILKERDPPLTDRQHRLLAACMVQTE